MTQVGDVGCAVCALQLGQQLVLVNRALTVLQAPVRRAGHQPLMIERLQQRPEFGKLAQAIETDGIEPLEDVSILAMLRRAAMLLDEALDLFKTRDDALLAVRPA